MTKVQKGSESGAANTLIIDVRSPEEFRQEANPKSRNIPINDFPKRMQELDKSKHYVLCCASGGRSGMALMMMKGAGFKHITNAGPWQNTL